MAAICGFLTFISILGVFASVIWMLIQLVRRKNLKVPMIVICSFIGMIIIFSIIGATSYKTTRKNENVENQEIKEELLEQKEQDKLIETSSESQTNAIIEETESNNIQATEIGQTDITYNNSNFQKAVESIGMDFSNVKNIQNLEDWASGKRYSFMYDGFEYLVYELDNGEINSINTSNKRTKIYERGYVPLSYKDFEPDINILDDLQDDALRQLSKYIIGETSIKTKIGSMLYSRIYDYYSISGEIKAKNEISKENYTFTVDYIVNENSFQCVYVAVDGKIYFGEDKTPEIKRTQLVTENEPEESNIIVLSYDKEGKYGQYDLFDGEEYLRYYIPSGKYNVKCNIRGGFYIETIELHKEDGWDTATTISQIMMSAGEEKEITIKDGQCISLIINTEIELVKE